MHVKSTAASELALVFRREHGILQGERAVPVRIVSKGLRQISPSHRNVRFKAVCNWMNQNVGFQAQETNLKVRGAWRRVVRMEIGGEILSDYIIDTS